MKVFALLLCLAASVYAAEIAIVLPAKTTESPTTGAGDEERVDHENCCSVATNVKPPRTTDDLVTTTPSSIAAGACSVFDYEMPVGETKRRNAVDHRFDKQTTVWIDTTNAMGMELTGTFEDGKLSNNQTSGSRMLTEAEKSRMLTGAGESRMLTGEHMGERRLTNCSNCSSTEAVDEVCEDFDVAWYAIGYRSPHAISTSPTHVEACPATKPHVWDDDHLNDNWNWTTTGTLTLSNCTSTWRLNIPVVYKCGGLHKEMASFQYVPGQEHMYIYIRNIRNDTSLSMAFQAQTFEGWYDVCSILWDIIVAIGGLLALLVALFAGAALLMIAVPLCCCATCVYCCFCRKKNN